MKSCLTPIPSKIFRSRYREAFGAAFKDDEIYEAVSNSRKYLGMENWLPFFYENKLPTLFDYIPLAAVIAGRNVGEAVKSKTESIADYYTARLEALKVKSAAEVDVYRPVPPEEMFLTAAEFQAILNKEQAAAFTNLTLPEDENTLSAGVLPGREFAQARSVTAAQVYDDLKAYLQENGKLRRIIFCLFRRLARTSVFADGRTRYQRCPLC